jgi:hypothetical protein
VKDLGPLSDKLYRCSRKYETAAGGLDYVFAYGTFIATVLDIYDGQTAVLTVSMR